jgi:hypothetical protein
MLWTGIKNKYIWFKPHSIRLREVQWHPCTSDARPELYSARQPQGHPSVFLFSFFHFFIFVFFVFSPFREEKNSVRVASFSGSFMYILYSLTVINLSYTYIRIKHQLKYLLLPLSGSDRRKRAMHHTTRFTQFKSFEKWTPKWLADCNLLMLHI